jgi:hypothetical protein
MEYGVSGIAIEMMFLIEKILGVLAAVVISCAQLIYLVHTIRRKVRPSVLSWVGWSFLMGTSVVSQVVAKGWQWSMTSVLSSAVGCLTIGLVALLAGTTRSPGGTGNFWAWVRFV